MSPSALEQINNYAPDYGDGRGALGYAVTEHVQVRSKYGFTCDKTIKCIVEAFNQAGFKTIFSCENTRKWVVPRAEVAFGHADPYLLLRFCLYLNGAMENGSDGSGGWGVSLWLDKFHPPNVVSASVNFTASHQGLLRDVIIKWNKS